MSLQSPPQDFVDSYRGTLLFKKNGKFRERFVLFMDSWLYIYKSNKLEFSFKLPSKFEVTPVGRSFIITFESSPPLVFETISECELNCWVNVLRSNPLPFRQRLSMEDFKIISIIGRGFYGKVMLAQLKTTGELFAIKSVRKAKLESSCCSVISEKRMLMKIHHPFIVQLCFAFQTDSKFYLGLEFVQGGELFFHMQRFGVINIDDSRLYIAEIALALQFLHSIGIVYRDLKPENVLLDADGHIKLTDFGLAKELIDGEQTSTFCGSSEYLAPELILRQPYGAEIDIWALGILAYEMLFGATPFCDDNRSKMYEKIINQPLHIPSGTDDRFCHFFRGMLEKDPKKRFTIDQMKNEPLFEGFDWNLVYNKVYVPNFIPSSVDPCKNFDPEFTRESASDSFVAPISNGQSHIRGFSFVDSLYVN